MKRKDNPYGQQKLCIAWTDMVVDIYLPTDGETTLISMTLDEAARVKRLLESVCDPVQNTDEEAFYHEAALLGSMILDWRVIPEAQAIIFAEDEFDHEPHRLIYSALVDLYERDGAIDLVKLNQTLHDRGYLAKVGGVDYLLELAESVPSAASADYYARRVHEAACKRRQKDGEET